MTDSMHEKSTRKAPRVTMVQLSNISFVGQVQHSVRIRSFMAFVVRRAVFGVVVGTGAVRGGMTGMLRLLGMK